MAKFDQVSVIAPLRKRASDNNHAQAHYQLGNALERLGDQAGAERERKLSAQIQVQQQTEYTEKLTGKQ